MEKGLLKRGPRRVRKIICGPPLEIFCTVTISVVFIIIKTGFFCLIIQINRLIEHHNNLPAIPSLCSPCPTIMSHNIRQPPLAPCFGCRAAHSGVYVYRSNQNSSQELLWLMFLPFRLINIFLPFSVKNPFRPLPHRRPDFHHRRDLCC